MRQAVLWALVGTGVLLVFIVFNLFQPGASPQAYFLLPYSDLLTRAAGGEVKQVVFQGHTLSGTDGRGRQFRTYLPEDPTLASRLAGQGVQVRAADEDPGQGVRVVVSLMPSVVFLVVSGFFMRRLSNEVRALRRVVEKGRTGLP